MATEAQINAVVDAIVSAFDGDAVKFKVFLQRAALETELAQIESEIRKKESERDVSHQGYQGELVALQSARSAKVSEIDALE